MPLTFTQEDFLVLEDIIGKNLLQFASNRQQSQLNKDKYPHLY